MAWDPCQAQASAGVAQVVGEDGKPPRADEGLLEERELRPHVLILRSRAARLSRETRERVLHAHKEETVTLMASYVGATEPEALHTEGVTELVGNQVSWLRADGGLPLRGRGRRSITAGAALIVMLMTALAMPATSAATKYVDRFFGNTASGGT